MGHETVSWNELTTALSIVSGGIVGAGALVAGIVIFLWTKFNGLEREMASDRVENAKTYVTTAALIKVEEKLSSSIEKLGERIERLLDRR